MRHSTRRLLSLIAACGVLLPGLATADWEEGVAAFTSKDYKEAAKHFQEVIDQQPELPQGYLMLGQSLLRDRQPAAAVAPLRKALELKAGDVQTQLILGQALYQAKKYSEAAQMLSKIDGGALSAKQRPAFYQMRGVAHQKNGNERQSLADLAQAAQLSPNNAQVHFAFGTASLKAGDTSVAIRALGKAVELDGKDPAKLKAYTQALLRKARLDRTAKEETYRRAASVAESLARQQPTFDNLLLLGEVQLGAKQYDGAIVSLEKARSKNPGHWLPNYYIGQAHTANGAFTEAEEPLNVALTQTASRDDQSKIWNQLGFVFEKQRKFDAAIDAYRKGGNATGEQRVAENKQIDLENREVEEHNRLVEQLEKEAKALEEELGRLPGAAPPKR